MLSKRFQTPPTTLVLIQGENLTSVVLGALMAKLKDLSLEELYDRPKITPAVWTNILAQEDFTQLQNTYCDKVCILKDRCQNRAEVDTSRADIVIIQDHNATDDRYKSGEQVERMRRRIIDFLIRKHFPGSSVKLVNLLRCKVTNRALGKASSLSETTIKKCSPYALEEIRSARPKALICLSTVGCKVLDLRDGRGKHCNMIKSRGEVRYWGDVPVVVSLHPKYMMMIRQTSSGQMWGPDYFEVLDRDFYKAGKLASGELVIPDLDETLEAIRKRLWVPRSLSEAKKAVELLSSLPRDQVLSYDLETSTLDPFSPHAKILTAQFGFRADDGGIQPVVFPLWHRENKGYIPEEVWELLVPVLLGPNPKVGHNMKFDVLYTYTTQGVRVANVAFDTMLILHCLNSGIQKNYGLKRGVWDFLPECGLAGYEDKLPELSTAAEITRHQALEGT